MKTISIFILVFWQGGKEGLSMFLSLWFYDGGKIIAMSQKFLFYNTVIMLQLVFLSGKEAL